MSRGSTFDDEPGTEAVADDDDDDAVGTRETRRFLAGVNDEAAEVVLQSP